MFDASAFWPVFRASGLLQLATVKQRGGPVDVYVGYLEPDHERLIGTGRSKDYEIEYQAADLVRVAEGDQVTIWSDDAKSAGVKFKLRESPYTDEGSDGYFRRAVLTKL